MRKIIYCFLLLAANAVLARPRSAQSITTDPVGFTTTTLLANSDTMISIPFTRPPEFTGVVESIAGNVIRVAGTTGWATNQFVYAVGTQPKTYFVLIGAGSAANPKEGHSYFITANGSNTLIVDTSTDPLDGIAPDTRVIVIPYWTPAALFPPGDANISFTPTVSTSSYKTQILVPNNSVAGTNLPVTKYFFSNNVDGTPNNVGWRVVGSSQTDRGDDPLPLNGYLVVRNLNGSPTLSVKGIGVVLTKKLATPLRTLPGEFQDNAVSMTRPIDVTVDQTGLSPSDGSFVVTPPPSEDPEEKLSLTDQLLLFDNSVAGFDKSPSAIYYYGQGSGRQRPGWKLLGDTVGGYRGGDVIPAGSAMVLRKANTADGAAVFWTNPPTY
jgi:uncharacterized protein (TIGR02597 family)